MSVGQYGLLVHTVRTRQTTGVLFMCAADSCADLFFDSWLKRLMFNHFLSLHQGRSFTPTHAYIIDTREIIKEQENLECLMLRDLSPSRLISAGIH